MIAGVSGLPSLGGLSGGVGAGPLPMVGFGVLNNLAGQLLTRPMAAPTQAAPAFAPQELALGQLSNNFGSYFGTTSMPAFWGGPPADLAWRQWATGTAMPPLHMAPFGIPAAAFGAPGGPVGFGVAGMPLAVNMSFGGAQQFMPGFGQIPTSFAGAPQMNPLAAAPQMGQAVNMAPMPPMNFGQAPMTNFATGNWGASGVFGSQTGGSQSQSAMPNLMFSPDAINNAMASAAQQFQKAMEDQKVQQAAQAAMAARISQAGKEGQAAQAALATRTAETARLGQEAQAAQTTLSAKTNQAAMAAQTVQMAQMGLNMARAAAAQSPDDAAATAAVREAEAQLAKANQADQAARQAQADAEAQAARTDQAWKSSQAAEAPLTARLAAISQVYESLRAEEAAIRQAQVDAFAADAMARMNAMQDQISSSFANSAQRFQVPPR